MNTGNPIHVCCNDRDRILADGTEQECSALELHARTCAVCAEELRAWKALSLAAQEMRDYSASLALWPRIERALSAEAAKRTRPAHKWRWLLFWQPMAGSRLVWQTVAVAAFALMLTFSAAWLYLHAPKPAPVASTSPLLKDSALAEVEQTEKAYQRAIEKLAAQAKPQLENPATPLLTSYREKLLVIDSAIDDLRAQAGMNPSNAHLRRQLLAMYQGKQQTLQDVLEAKAP